MRIDSTLYYILKDHLGSASVVTNASGVLVGDQRYYPYGETRLTSGSMFTDRLFTSQREMAGLGIYDYGARFYSPKLGRFLSADTIVLSYENPQNLNRFSYGLNNPSRYTDPTGHRPCEDYQGSCLSEKQVTKIYKANVQKQKEKSKNKPNGDDNNDLDLLIGLHPNSCTSDTCNLPPDSSNPYDDYYLYGAHQSPRWSDYYNFTFGFSVPGLGAFVSLAPTIILDRFGNVYGGLGISFGPEAPLGVAPSLVGGWISDGPPNEERSEQFLSGMFVNVGGGAAIGAGWNWNPINGGHSWDAGLFWPQISGTVGGTIYLYDAHRQEPLWGP